MSCTAKAQFNFAALTLAGFCVFASKLKVYGNNHGTRS